jgi:fatty-acid desaturase
LLRGSGNPDRAPWRRFGFHRLLTHRSFETSNAFKYLLAAFGTLALQAGPVTWVADHRLHHKKTDQDDDPHTPRYSLLWAHLGWTVFVFPERAEVKYRMARDISRDRVLMFFDNYNWVIGGVCFLLLFLVGSASTVWSTACPCSCGVRVSERSTCGTAPSW